MKVAILNTQGGLRSVFDHTEGEGNTLKIEKDTEAILVERPTDILEVTVPVGNSCIGVANLMMREDLRKGFFQVAGVFPEKSTVSSVFAFFNGTDFSDWLEVAYSDRLLSGEVGPRVGFTTGCGLKVKESILEALPGLLAVRDALRELNYRGEILCGVAEDFTLTNISFGHFWGHFGMFTEMCTAKTQGVLEFIFGKVPMLELYESCCVSNLVTLPPFPIPANESQRLNAPKSAEKHLWRIQYGPASEIVLIAVHGSSVGEARRRCRRTLDNMRQYEDTIQYRIDYGLRRRFVLCQRDYEQFSQKQELQQRSSSEGVGVQT